MGEYIGLVPPAEGFVQTPGFNFGRYSEIDAYKKVNNDLIDRVLLLKPIPGSGISRQAGIGCPVKIP